MPLLLVSIQCGGQQEPCGGVQKGDRVHIELVELVGPDHADEECLNAWSFGPGTEFDANVLRLTAGGPSCRSGLAEIDGVGDWTFTRDPERVISGGTTLGGHYDAQSGACSGQVSVGVGTEEGVSCEPTDERCGVGVHTTPSSDNAPECPAGCSGDFLARVERLQ
jgi:hypothetical protein